MARSHTHHAGDFLAYLLPKRTLHEIRELALAYERDAAIRTYLAKRAWFILPMGFLFLINSGTCVIGGLILGKQLFTEPSPFWLQWVVFIGSTIVFVGMMMVQLCVLFIWLGKRASRATGLIADSDLDRIASRREGNEVFLLALFVIVSLGIVALVIPPVAAALAVVVILAPVVLTIFHRR